MRGSRSIVPQATLIAQLDDDRFRPHAPQRFRHFDGLGWRDTRRRAAQEAERFALVRRQDIDLGHECRRQRLRRSWIENRGQPLPPRQRQRTRHCV